MEILSIIREQLSDDEVTFNPHYLANKEGTKVWIPAKIKGLLYTIDKIEWTKRIITHHQKYIFYYIEREKYYLNPLFFTSDFDKEIRYNKEICSLEVINIKTGECLLV